MLRRQSSFPRKYLCRRGENEPIADDKSTRPERSRGTASVRDHADDTRPTPLITRHHECQPLGARRLRQLWWLVMSRANAPGPQVIFAISVGMFARQAVFDLIGGALLMPAPRTSMMAFVRSWSRGLSGKCTIPTIRNWQTTPLTAPRQRLIHTNPRSAACAIPAAQDYHLNVWSYSSSGIGSASAPTLCNNRSCPVRALRFAVCYVR